MIELLDCPTGFKSGQQQKQDEAESIAAIVTAARACTRVLLSISAQDAKHSMPSASMKLY